MSFPLFIFLLWSILGGREGGMSRRSDGAVEEVGRSAKDDGFDISWWSRVEVAGRCVVWGLITLSWIG